jgi:hypothetical protein
MKYVYYHQKYDDGLFSREAVDKNNADNLEEARIGAWHKTFNAALTGLITVADNGDAIEYATKVANKVHGEL